jgi:hypothetical protein
VTDLVASYLVFQSSIFIWKLLVSLDTPCVRTKNQEPWFYGMVLRYGSVTWFCDMVLRDGSVSWSCNMVLSNQLQLLARVPLDSPLLVANVGRKQVETITDKLLVHRDVLLQTRPLVLADPPHVQLGFPMEVN